MGIATLDEESPCEVIASRALSWLERKLVRFDPFARGREADEFHQTALAELALVCEVLNRNRALAESGRLVAFFDLIEKVFNQPAFYENLYCIKQSFIAHLIIHNMLRRQARDSPLTDEEIQRLIDIGYATSERTAFRWLELRYALDAGSFRHDLPSEAELFRLTALGQRVSADSLIEQDVYSITHTIFYLTDFGLRYSPLIAKQEGTVVMLEELIARAIEARNPDLVAELILSRDCLRARASESIRRGWLHLDSVQQRDGMIRGAELILPEAMSPQEQDEFEFMRFYHPTIMTALAGLLERQSEESLTD